MMRIRRKVVVARINDHDEFREAATGAGIRSTISISNTKKITAKRKNRVENGIRAFLLGSNPHSNGEDFSRSFILRALRMNAAVRTTGGMMIAIRKEKVVISILQWILVSVFRLKA